MLLRVLWTPLAARLDTCRQIDFLWLWCLRWESRVQATYTTVDVVEGQSSLVPSPTEGQSRFNLDNHPPPISSVASVFLLHKDHRKTLYSDNGDLHKIAMDGGSS